MVWTSKQFFNYPWEEEVLIPPFMTFEVIWDGKRAWIWLHCTETFSKYT